MGVIIQMLAASISCFGLIEFLNGGPFQSRVVWSAAEAGLQRGHEGRVGAVLLTEP
jgi:hypothetical protein